MIAHSEASLTGQARTGLVACQRWGLLLLVIFAIIWRYTCLQPSTYPHTLFIYTFTVAFRGICQVLLCLNPVESQLIR